MPDEPSVTTIIVGLKKGNSAAAEQLWVRYFDQLVAAARRRLGTVPRRAFDEEDVALSVFDSLCRGAERGHFAKLTDRDDLWALLLAMSRQKAVDRIRRERRLKRGGGAVRGESVFWKAGGGSVVIGMDQIAAEEPSPEFLAILQDQHQWLFEHLPDDTMRRVVEMRMEGYTVKEIASQLGFTTRWVERKLQLARKEWLRVLQAAAGDD